MSRSLVVLSRKIFYVFLLFCATGCAAHLSLTGNLPGGTLLKEVAHVDAGTPFAPDATGESIAFVDGGLRIMETGSGAARLISPDVPTALAWSTDGKQLAAAFDQGEDAALRIYERQGNLLAETRIPGRASGLAWRSATELLAFSVRYKRFTFGVNQTETLYQWDGKNEPAATVLYGTTLKPTALKQWGGTFQRTLTFSLSPLQDEILYLQIHDPPAFKTYAKLVLRNLESGAEREIAETTLLSSGGTFSGNGDYILYGDGQKESLVLDPWEQRLITAMAVPGQEAAFSPSGRILLLDGHLYRDGAEVASFPETCKGIFTSRGGRLVLQHNERLYLLSGLPDESPPPAAQAVAERLKQLRKWLSEGLITSQEYRRAREQGAP